MPSLLNSRQEQNQSDRLRFVREKIRKLEMEMAKIRTAKETFLENFSITNKTIEEMTRNISRYTQERGESLKHRLRDIVKEKVTEWDRQLELCLQAEKNITDSIPGVSATLSTFDDSIGFIDSGDVRFEEDMTVLTKITNFGTVSSVDHPVVGENRVFSHPLGVCSDPSGRILVSNRANNNIQVFTYKGGFLTAFGQKGTSMGQFRSLQDVTIEHCDIAVRDTQNRRVQLFSPHCGFITQFCFRSDLSPYRVAFWDAGLLVPNPQNHRLLKHNYFSTGHYGRGGGVNKERALCLLQDRRFAGKNSGV